MKTKLFLALFLISSISFAQTWNQIGTAEFTNTGADVALALNSSGVPYVAFADTTVDGKVHVMKFDGTNWIEIGTNVSPAIVPTHLSISINPVSGQPWTTYKDTGTNRQVVKYFDGTDWILDIADVFGFEPLSKVQLKFSANGDATIASTNTSGTNQFHQTLVVKRKNNGQSSWGNDLSVVISEKSFDLVTANKVVASATEGAITTDKRVIYEYATSAWSSTYTSSSFTNRGRGVTAGDNNKILNNVSINSSENDLKGENGISTPPDNRNTKERIHQLIYNQHNKNNYAFYVQSNNDLRVLENDFFANTWTDLSPGLSMQANSSAKMELNSTGTELFIAYLSNNKVSVKSYAITLPLATIYVNASATGNNDGTSWANAFTELQSAIDAGTPGFSKIWVSKGTYKPGTTRTDSFLINNVIEIYGGFNGTETMLSERNPKTNITILSGDLNGDDNTVITNTEATRQDNAYHVVTLKGNFVSGGIIDGFTISGGNANGSLSNSCNTTKTQQFAHDRAAAVYANPDNEGHKVYMKFNNCIIEKNTSTKVAVHITFSPCGASGTLSDIDFENCVIRDNYTVDNANILYGASGTYSNLRYGSLVNCLLYNNESVNSASVIQLSASGGNGAANKVNIINTTITGNISGINKTVKLNNVAFSKIQNSIIYNNGGFQPIDITGNTTISNNNIIQGAQLGGSPSDPLFTNPSNNDFTLQATSPALDSGNNAYVPSNITFDLNGNARIYNTTVDMGAFEYDPSILSTESISLFNDIKMYPNPVKNNLFVSSEEEITKIEIYNLLGKKIIEKENSTKVNLSNLKPSIYIIRVHTLNNSISKRIIKN